MIKEIPIVVKSIIQGGALGFLIGTIIFLIEQWIESKIESKINKAEIYFYFKATATRYL